MASTQIMVVLSLLLFPLAFHSIAADLDEQVPFKALSEKKGVVEGMVYCQSCKDLGTWSLSGVEPVPLARVSVTCKNHNKRVFYYKDYTTNEYGYFYAELEGFSLAHYLFDRPLTACKVKLVSSSVKSCNVPTKVNNGITGATLRRKHKKFTKRGCMFYVAGPLAFRPPQCISKETHY